MVGLDFLVYASMSKRDLRAVPEKNIGGGGEKILVGVVSRIKVKHLLFFGF